MADALITDKYAYDTWGNLLSHTSAHYQDTNMGGLLQLGVRFLDPSVGRFTQVDPVHEIDDIGYHYTDAIPTNRIDVDGRKDSLIDRISDKIYRWVVNNPCIREAYDAAKRMHDYNDKLAHCYFGCRAMACTGAGYLQAMMIFIGMTVVAGEDDPMDVRADIRGIGIGDIGFHNILLGVINDLLSNCHTDYCYYSCLYAIQDLPNDMMPIRRKF